MTRPQISVVVPVYNVAPYLRECLDSVWAQTFTDWEAICVPPESAPSETRDRKVRRGAATALWRLRIRRVCAARSRNGGIRCFSQRISCLTEAAGSLSCAI